MFEKKKRVVLVCDIDALEEAAAVVAEDLKKNYGPEHIHNMAGDVEGGDFDYEVMVLDGPFVSSVKDLFSEKLVERITDLIRSST